MQVFKSLILSTLLGFSFFTSYASAPVSMIDQLDEPIKIGTRLLFAKDSGRNLTAREILKSGEFRKFEGSAPNFGMTEDVIWIQLKVNNQTEENEFIMELSYAILDKFEVYEINEQNIPVLVGVGGEEIPYEERAYDHPRSLLDINIPAYSEKSFLIRVRSEKQVTVPVRIGSKEAIFGSIARHDIGMGIYFGIILVMLFYNLFVAFSTKESSYYFYVIYILFVGLTQAGTQGFTYQYLWPSSPWLSNQSDVILPVLVGITAMLFLRDFISTRENLPKLDKGFFALIALYTACAVMSLAGMTSVAFMMTQVSAMLASIYMIIVAYISYRRGSRQAGFFLMAWSIFLVGVVVFVLKDVGVLPYNSFTRYVLHIGSAIEVVLLSFALADKINEYRAEKLEALRENERMIIEQNVILEQKVDERTQELKEKNNELAEAIENLKNTQAQLVEAEKMASLGQLTAGIAHEINNPINFVKSNIIPLRRDIDDLLEVLGKYDEISVRENLNGAMSEVNELKEEIEFDLVKEEIGTLMNDIEMGASRTAEIVKGLQSFSRHDEAEHKKANINDCITSTLRLVMSKYKSKINIRKDLAVLPDIMCFPGKLNQVFMNILNNAAQAILDRDDIDEGIIQIRTKQEDENIIIEIEDNGGGIPEDVLPKIFDPFFTTKDVGSGTGLGLSIVYKIIEGHDGKIKVDSRTGEGTTFIITLPVKTDWKD